MNNALVVLCLFFLIGIVFAIASRIISKEPIPLLNYLVAAVLWPVIMFGILMETSERLLRFLRETKI